jgi:periplasmic protein TonB
MAGMRSLLRWMQSSQNTGAPEELQQRRRLQLALTVLVIALFVVVVRDVYDMRPPTPVSPSPSTVAQSSTEAAPSTSSAEVIDTQARPEPPARHSNARQARVKGPIVNASHSLADAAGPTIVATDRAVLPPLEVSVVAGNQNRPIAPRSNSVDVDMQGASSPETAQSPQPIPDSETPQPGASPNVTVSRDVAARVTHSVAPSYPLLAKQMKVQGAVVLQALIDKGGRIQNLRVVSGPAILAAAAQEAVKQWRFKPYYQNGQAVETEARVSVNFTISTF